MLRKDVIDPGCTGRQSHEAVGEASLSRNTQRTMGKQCGKQHDRALGTGGDHEGKASGATGGSRLESAEGE
eukprot:6707974-Alexandrium_andersonii.AAC.1